MTEQGTFWDPPPTACRHGRVGICALCALPDGMVIARRLHQVRTEQTRRDAQPEPETAETLREQVYRAIVAFGPICDQRIATVTGLADNTERPRRLELERAGRIEPSGTEHTRSGKLAVAWVATGSD